MRFPLPDLLDKISILQLKIQNIDEKHLKNELDLLGMALINYNISKEKCEEFLQKLYNINGEIWKLESDIRKGKENELGLEEVGRRAIQIREWNKKRISIKNQIVEETGEGFKDIKMNHISE